MGLKQIILVSVLWGCIVLVNFISCCNQENETTAARALRDGIPEPRGRHRLQLLFPLLLRISARLATLVPTALMGLFGIILFVVFSKKALLVSLFALFLILSDKLKSKKDDLYIHNVNPYLDYNDEQHIHYHHHGPPKSKIHYYERNNPYKKWKKNIKRTILSLPTPIKENVQPFKPLPGI